MSWALKFVSYMILLITVLCTAVLTSPPTTESVFPETVCLCAVFKLGADPLTCEPIIVRNTEIEMTPDAEGRRECSEMCVALAEAAKSDGPNFLCRAVKEDVDNLFVTVFSQLSREPWNNTGKNSTIPICCKGNLPVLCPGVGKVPHKV